MNKKRVRASDGVCGGGRTATMRLKTHEVGVEMWVSMCKIRRGHIHRRDELLATLSSVTYCARQHAMPAVEVWLRCRRAIGSGDAMPASAVVGRRRPSPTVMCNVNAMLMPMRMWQNHNINKNPPVVFWGFRILNSAPRVLFIKTFFG